MSLKKYQSRRVCDREYNRRAVKQDKIDSNDSLFTLLPLEVHLIIIEAYVSEIKLIHFKNNFLLIKNKVEAAARSGLVINWKFLISSFYFNKRKFGQKVKMLNESDVKSGPSRLLFRRCCDRLENKIRRGS